VAACHREGGQLLLGRLEVGVVVGGAGVTCDLPHCRADQRLVLKFETDAVRWRIFNWADLIVVGAGVDVPFGKVGSGRRAEGPAGQLLLGGVNVGVVGVRGRVVTPLLLSLFLATLGRTDTPSGVLLHRLRELRLVLAWAGVEVVCCLGRVQLSCQGSSLGLRAYDASELVLARSWGLFLYIDRLGTP